ncbi:MAG: carboxypeptidase M32 [Alphaproteobacteria bacterium]
MTEAAAYAELERRFARLNALDGAGAVLDWDSQTMMPKGGAETRAEQSAALALVGHELLTDPTLAELLDRAEADEAAGLDPWRAANLAEMRRRWIHAAATEARLVEALSKATSACEMRWRTARPDDDFAGLRPSFEEVVALTRESAAARGEALGCAPYDALLDEYEPGGRSARIDALFADLAAYLPGFIAQALEHQAGKPAPRRLDGPFPVAAQRALGRRLMAVVGFEFEHGRLDVSDHPFCGGTPDDVRITTRYREDDFTKAMMAVLHETGHAMYERGLPSEWRRQPVGQAAGMSLHESQSLLLEMQACRSREFIAFAAPLMREAFGRDGTAWQADNLLRLSTRVEASLIRVDADEVTYPAHILLRYRLEKALIAGDLEVRDLPDAWHEGMAELLGVTPLDDRDGCLQDVHWFGGLFGYFPTYTLGAMIAAQLFAAARRADADILPAIGRGDFVPLFRWLRANVHGLGSSLTTDELVAQATGRPLDAAVFKAHLEARYLS